jgi:hypothetical protein
MLLKIAARFHRNGQTDATLSNLGWIRSSFQTLHTTENVAMSNEHNNPQHSQNNPQQGGQNKPGQQQQGGQKPGQQQGGQKPGQQGGQNDANR